MTEDTQETEAPRRGRPPNVARAPQRPAQRHIITSANRFDVPHSLIVRHPDMSFEWKVETVMGQEQAERKIEQENNGWEYVPQDVCPPELVGKNPQKGKPVLRGGQALKWRPKELTEESRRIDSDLAREQMSTQRERIAGESRRQVGDKLTRVTRTTEEIPDEV